MLHNAATTLNAEQAAAKEGCSYAPFANNYHGDFRQFRFSFTQS
jgi:hypothetical protein